MYQIGRKRARKNSPNLKKFTPKMAEVQRWWEKASIIQKAALSVRKAGDKNVGRIFPANSGEKIIGSPVR